MTIFQAPPLLDADLVTIAGLTATSDSFIQSKASAWASRTVAEVLVDLAAAGTTFQPLDATLTALAGVTFAANKILVSTAADTVTTKTYPQTTLDNGILRSDGTTGDAQTSGLSYEDVITLADDTATSLATVNGGEGELVFITAAGGAAGSPRGLFWVRGITPTALNIAMVNTTNIVFTTGILSGTTGADTNFNISSHTDNKIYFENRTGASRNFNVMRMRSNT